MYDNKKRNIKQIASFAFLIICSLFCSAQQDSLQSLQSQLAYYNWASPQEKIFVHTDKDFYLSGEIIWFKIYNVDDTIHQLSGWNKVCYIEILDKDHRPAFHAKIKMENGIGNGSFVVPGSVNSGVYVFRAYSNWMKNFSPDLYFEKQVTIVNPNKRPDWSSLEKGETLDVRFFPEGGNLVYGMESRIAIHAVDQYGKGIKGFGYILDHKKDTVARFQSLHFGIGSFYFTPLEGNEYKAFFLTESGKSINISLPAPYKNGYVMRMDDSDNRQLSITVHTNLASSAYLYLLVHTRQKIKAALTAEVTGGMANFLLNKNILDEGITHLTVFNQERQPLCERLYFRQPEQNLKLDLKSLVSGIGSRAKVGLDIFTHNQKDKPVICNLSASVYRLDSLQNAGQSDIVSYFWLSSDLKGTIESPGFYLINDPKVREAADNLMLTQGWSRIKWEDFTKNTKPAFSFLPEYEGHVFKGTVINKRTSQPGKNVLVYLSCPGTGFHLSNAVSDEKGEISFVVKDFYGSNEIVIQTNPSDSVFRVDLSNPYSVQFSNNPQGRFVFNENWKDQLMFHSFHVQVQEAFEQPGQQHFVVPGYLDTIPFYTEADKSYFLDNYTRFPTMEEVMREFISKVRVRKEAGNFHYYVMNTPYKSYFDKDPLVLLDGVPVFDINKIIAFDPLKIKKIDVVARKYYLGNLVNDGIVSYSTYGGDMANFELDPNSIILEFEGMQLKREFYSPVYDSPEKKASPLPDSRNVLLWAPDIKTDDNGKDNISFYTSDLEGNFAVVVQGISSTGIPVSAIKLFTVSQKNEIKQ